MHFSAGDRLGPYEIVAQVGAGGMGVVYRARDSRVGRDVAIKVSSEHFSDRFEHEARAVAALNHPNICTLHDVGPDFLVMEFVDGESPKGPLPLETVLEYARQIADALDAAHEKGIVHRDLKPANIKIRPDGTVKVLDFGLAKIDVGVANAIDPQHSPTMAAAATQAGVILGTAAYMAPEQARGKPVDKRADIWAFGVVFYEMLTGRRAFDGDDVSMILAAVIQSEPRWDGVPANVRRLLESCLQKDPRKRLRDIGDVWKLLDDAPTSIASRSRNGRAGWMAAAALAVVAAVALWAPWRSAPRNAAQPLVRLDVDLGQDVSLLPLAVPTFSSLIISPDGTRLVFVGSVSGGPPRLYVRRLNESQIVELVGTQGASNPFFSPDGQWVAFWNGTSVAKVPLDGGAAVPLADLDTMTGGTWADDGSLMVGMGLPSSSGMMRIPSGGEMASSMLMLGKDEAYYTFPQILPGQKSVLVAVVRSPPAFESTNVDIISLVDGRRKTVVRGATSPRYLASGHIMYANQAGLFAVPFDIDRWETRGAAVPILNDVASDPVTRGGQFAVSRDGTLVYRRGNGGAPAMMRVQWIDASGKPEPLLTKAGLYVGPPRLSPDGRHLALAIRDGGNQDIWVYDTQRDAMTRLTFGGGTFVNPVWSRSGRYLLFGTLGGSMFWTPSDGSGRPQALLSGKSFYFPSSVSVDGKRLAFERIDARPQVWSVELEENEAGLKIGTPYQFLTTPFTDSDLAFSPDGRWVAYHSDESGKNEVYVRPFSPSSVQERKLQVSNGGGAAPIWSPNGRELLYLAGDQIMAVSYKVTGESFLGDKPRVWAVANGATRFDVAPDGKRVAVMMSESAPDVPKRDGTIVFVQNFFDELRRRAPVAR